MLVGKTSQGRRNNDYGSSTSLRYTKQLYLNGYMRTNIKGRVLQIFGNLPLELAKLGTQSSNKGHISHHLINSIDSKSDCSLTNDVTQM